jgi:hypothetical protein
MTKLAFLRSPQTQAVLDAVEQAAAAQQQASAIGDISRLGLSALGVGAIARGLGGLMSSNMKPMEKRYGPSTVTLPYPVPVKKKKQPKVAGDAEAPKEKPFRPSLLDIGLSTGGAALGGAGGLVGGRALGGETVNALNNFHLSIPREPLPGATTASKAAPLWKNMRQARGLGRNWGSAVGALTGLFGGLGLGHLIGYHTENTPRQKSSTDKTSMPWYRPAMTLTGLAGLYGGWKTVDSVMDSQRRKAREKELDEAKQEFHNVLVGDPGMKTACESLVTRLGSLFDKMAQLVEHVKTAGPLSDMAGSATGMYGTYAALSGLATGAIVYEQARKRQRRAILDKAMKKRQLQQYKMSPPEIIAVPEPVEVK